MVEYEGDWRSAHGSVPLLSNYTTHEMQEVEPFRPG